MTTSIPDGFGPEFLDWFSAHTEAYWANIPEATPEQTLTKYVKWRSGGSWWRRGTKWLDGLGDAEVNSSASEWGLHFPPDYRLFLRRLHTVDKPRWRAHYLGWDEAPQPEESYLATALVHEPGSSMVLEEGPSCYDWMNRADSIRDALEQVVEGLAFDVEENYLWPESWGTKPDTAEEREQHVRALVAAAPKLIPIYEHRFLLAEPCEAGNPVLSIHQSDIIVYGADLHDYFLIEFADELLALSRNDEAVKAAKARISDILRYEPICLG
jgi:hypothetical protein